MFNKLFVHAGFAMVFNVPVRKESGTEFVGVR